jgi:hypothetical protein
MILFPNFMARSEAMAKKGEGDKVRRKNGATAQYIKTPIGDQIFSDFEQHGSS